MSYNYIALDVADFAFCGMDKFLPFKSIDRYPSKSYQMACHLGYYITEVSFYITNNIKALDGFRKP